MSKKTITTDPVQRCNHCMSIFDEALTACPNCGKDDALMHPFTPAQTHLKKVSLSACNPKGFMGY